MTARAAPRTLQGVTPKVLLEALALPTLLLDDKPAAPGGPVPRWLHLCTEGTRKGHPAGAFTLDAAVFAQFIANLRGHPQFKLGANGKGSAPVIPFDYEHASEMAPTDGNVPLVGCPAPAWLADLEVRRGADGRAELWGLALLGERIVQQIRAGEYRWLSIAFTLAGVDPVTGKEVGARLSSVAFTNKPFVQDLQPLAASTAAAARLAGAAPRAVPLADGSTTPESKVDETTTPTNDLSSLLAALGVTDPTAALAAIPELMAAKAKLADAMAQIDALTSAQAKVEEQMAEAEVGAALSLHFPDPKLAARVRPALVALRAKDRALFSQHYPLPPNAAGALLLSTLVAGKNGVQVEPPKPVTLGEKREVEGDRARIDLRALPGRNTTERIIAHLRQTDRNLANASLDVVMGRAHALRHDPTVELVVS